MSTEHRKNDYAATFGVTWLAYATYYLGRKGFSVSKARVVTELGLTDSTLAAIDTGYLGAYAIGQFVSGLIGDRVGARRLLSAGMICAAITCAAFGGANSGWTMVIAFTLNGFAQSTGWPSTTKAMSEWVPHERRGAVMGLWCTSYQVGGIVATWFCTLLLGHYGWRSAFLGPAVCIAAVGVLVFFTLKRGPHAVASIPSGDKPIRFGLDPEVFRNPILWSYGIAYFFIKLIRYSVLFWLPYYLHTALGLSETKAGYLSISFEVGGVIGAVAIGLISDKWAHFARSVIAAIGLVGLAAALMLYATLRPASDVLQFLLMSLVGALLFGPDSLVSAAAAQDAGGKAAAARATGFVNGVGSVGALLQGYVTVGLRKSYGWSAVFYVFVAFALMAAVALTPTFRKRAPLLT